MLQISQDATVSEKNQESFVTLHFYLIVSKGYLNELSKSDRDGLTLDYTMVESTFSFVDVTVSRNFLICDRTDTDVRARLYPLPKKSGAVF